MKHKSSPGCALIRKPASESWIPGRARHREVAPNAVNTAYKLTKRSLEFYPSLHYSNAPSFPCGGSDSDVAVPAAQECNVRSQITIGIVALWGYPIFILEASTISPGVAFHITLRATP
jgi:hypothetical protein